MENIRDNEIVELEKELLKQNVRGDNFKVYIWEENSSSIADNEDLKLIILSEEKKQVIELIIKIYGQNPRVNCNTVFFLFPLDVEKTSFSGQLRRYKAYQAIENDKNLNLTEEQRKNIRTEIKKKESELKEGIRRVYRQIGIPSNDGYKIEDLGVPTYGVSKNLDEEVYEKLRSSNEIIEQLVPLVIKERYLGKNPFVSTQQILQASYRTPGEPRLKNKNVLKQAIVDGVKNGIFGLGELENERPICKYFQESPEVGFSSTEILINADICKEQRAKEGVERRSAESAHKTAEDQNVGGTSGVVSELSVAISDVDDYVYSIHLPIEIPKGKVSDIARILNYLQQQFEILQVDIRASKGKLSKQDYENKVMEALRQLGINTDR